MLSFIAKRFVYLIPVLIGVSVITFTLSHLVPGDPARMIVGQRATEETVARMREELGLTKPIPVQYWNYVKGLTRGDLGTSIRSQRPVVKDLAERLPASLELTALSLLICLLVAIPLGITSAVKRNRPVDHVLRVFALFGVSMPVFWWGLILLLAFYVNLGWLPGPGRLSVGVAPPPTVTGLYLVDAALARDWTAWKDAARHIILPAFCLSYVYLAIMTRMVRASMLDVLNQEYIRTARANGLSERRIIWRHALRNALIPTVTILGLSFGELIGGAILTESIFAWPGLGSYMVESVEFLDFPAIMGFTILICLIYVGINLLVDIVYAWLDPQIRLG
ncbi:MAG TPA: ABC transporter permease [Firmicutes bacterium]|nr:ABC transporter permease [Bacillota bacterium]